LTLSVEVRSMTKNDIDGIFNALDGYDVSKPYAYIAKCWQENLAGERTTFLALFEGEVVGWGHIVHKPAYAYFADNGIPEIQNFDVIPPFRKRGVGSQLIEVIERYAFERYDVIGIGFGLYVDYGIAQRLYVKLGFIPDGRGLMYDNQPVVPGSQVKVDDDLVLFLTKDKPQ